MRGRARRLRREQCGAETLEFAAIVGLVGIVLMLGLRAFGVVELQLRAESDARTLARDAAVCQRDRPPLTLLSVDNQAPAAVAPTMQRTSDGLVAVTVTFESQEIVPDVAATAVTPQATVAMRREPGCP
jgi:hypothetical protein